jgi:hypothetical protein
MLKDYREKILNIEQHQGKRNVKLREAYNQLAQELNASQRTSLDNDEIQSVVGHVTSIMKKVNADDGNSLESALRKEFSPTSSLNTDQQDSLRRSLQHAMHPGLGGGGQLDVGKFNSQLESVMTNPSTENTRELWDLYNNIIENADSNTSGVVNSSAMSSVLGVLSDNSKLQGYVNKFLDSEYLADVVNTDLLPETVVHNLKQDFTDQNARSYLQQTVSAILSDSDVGQALIQGGGQQSSMGRVITAMNTFGMDTDMVMDIMKHTLKGDFRQTVNMLMDHFLPAKEASKARSSPTSESIYPSVNSLSGGGVLMDVYETPYDVFQKVFEDPKSASHSRDEYNEAAIQKAQDQFLNTIQSRGVNASAPVLDLARSVVKGALTRDAETMELLNTNKDLLHTLFNHR